MRTVRTYLKLNSDGGWENARSITEFTFKPESLTGFYWVKTHAVKVLIEHSAGLEDNFVEIYFDGRPKRNAPMMNRFFPANTVAVYKEHKAGR